MKIADKFLQEQEDKQIGVTSPDRLWLKRWFVQDVMRKYASQFTPTKERIIDAIDAEPELPGEMPDDLIQLIRDDNSNLQEMLRVIVKATKRGIKERILSLSADADKPIGDIQDIIDLIDRYWKFDDQQQHCSSWHDKQDLLDVIRNGNYTFSPAMSEQEIEANDLEYSQIGKLKKLDSADEVRNEPKENCPVDTKKGCPHLFSHAIDCRNCDLKDENKT